jgi:putative ABC transport system substrate-binding protein
VIGYLTLAAKPTVRDRIFVDSLRRLGWIEGRNLKIEYRRGGNDPDRLAALAGELVKAKPDLIVAQSTPAVLAAKNATQSIPLVTMSADPVGNKFVDNLARPAGNITGISMMMPQLAGKRLELLREIFPKLARVAFLAHGGDPAHRIFVREAEEAASHLGVHVQPVVVRSAADYESAFAAMKSEKADALIIQPLFINTLNDGPRLLQLAAQNRIPATSDGDGFAQAGGLLFYGPDPRPIYERLTVYVDRVLRGAKPGDLPIEQPEKFLLEVNLKTAKRLGVKVPQAVLVRADRVIE